MFDLGKVFAENFLAKFILGSKYFAKISPKIAKAKYLWTRICSSKNNPF